MIDDSLADSSIIRDCRLVIQQQQETIDNQKTVISENEVLIKKLSSELLEQSKNILHIADARRIRSRSPSGEKLEWRGDWEELHLASIQSAGATPKRPRKIRPTPASPPRRVNRSFMLPVSPAEVEAALERSAPTLPVVSLFRPIKDD